MASVYRAQTQPQCSNIARQVVPGPGARRRPGGSSARGVFCRKAGAQLLRGNGRSRIGLERVPGRCHLLDKPVFQCLIMPCCGFLRGHNSTCWLNGLHCPLLYSWHAIVKPAPPSSTPQRLRRGGDGLRNLLLGVHAREEKAQARGLFRHRRVEDGLHVNALCKQRGEWNGTDVESKASLWFTDGAEFYMEYHTELLPQTHVEITLTGIGTLDMPN